jgi:lactate permease
MREIGIAFLPFLMIFLMLFVFKQSSVRSGFAAYGTAVLLAIFVPTFHLRTVEIFDSSIHGILISSVVAYVLFFGILLFHLMNEAGLIRTIASFISHATDDPVRQVILLVVAFSPLVESSSGFGIAIIVIAPILIALGFPRYKAAFLSLVSLSAVPWGALATGTVIGANLGKIPLQTLGSEIALMSVPTFYLFAFASVLIAAGWKGLAQRWGELSVITGILAASIWLFSKYVRVELAGVLASNGHVFSQVSCTEAESEMSIIKAMSPYLFLTGFLFITRLLPGVEQMFQSSLKIDLPRYSFSLPLLYSPGFALLLTSLFTICLFRMRIDVIKKSWHYTCKQRIPVTLSTISFVAMSDIMSSSGMNAILAHAAASTLGPAFILFSPVIGGLGGFLTGSNTGANAMFIQLQIEAAHQLGMSPQLLAAAQCTSASHMTMASPSRVLLGATVCEIRTEENKILRNVSLIAVSSLLVIVLEMIIYPLFNV